MKKKIIPIVVIALIVVAAIFLFLSKMNGSGESGEAENEIVVESASTQVFNHTFPKEGKIGEAINQKVNVVVADEKDDSIEVSVEAPEISEELYEWYQTLSDEDYSDELLESTIVSMIDNSPKKKNVYTFTLVNGYVLFTEDYLNHISCGVEGFYQKLLGEALSSINGEEAEYE